MAEEVAEAMTTGQHQLVETGTGNGKPLGYLVPAVVTAAKDALQEEPSYAMLKAMPNEACLHRVREVA